MLVCPTAPYIPAPCIPGKARGGGGWAVGHPQKRQTVEGGHGCTVMSPPASQPAANHPTMEGKDKLGKGGGGPSRQNHRADALTGPQIAQKLQAPRMCVCVCVCVCVCLCVCVCEGGQFQSCSNCGVQLLRSFKVAAEWVQKHIFCVYKALQWRPQLGWTRP